MPESRHPTNFRIGDFRRVGEDGIHRQTHRQFPAFAVVDRAALWADFEDALLLMLGPVRYSL